MDCRGSCNYSPASSQTCCSSILSLVKNESSSAKLFLIKWCSCLANSKYLWGMLTLWLHVDADKIYMHSKCPPLAFISAHHRSMDAITMCCSMLCQTFNWKSWLTTQSIAKTSQWRQQHGENNKQTKKIYRSIPTLSRYFWLGWLVGV